MPRLRWLCLAALVLAGIFALVTCYRKSAMSSLPKLSHVKAKLAFTCTHEADHLPPLDPDADVLFKYARYLQRAPGRKDFNSAARYYRIAAAYGHYKANNNLQLLLSRGLADAPTPTDETVALANQLIDADIPAGYYNMAYYLQLGYGVKQDADLSLRYYRKAADMGSPDGQFRVAEKLSNLDDAEAQKVSDEMYQCAAQQGHGEAASAWAFVLSDDGRKQYAEAAQSFQWAVAAGDAPSAWLLENGFKGPLSSERLYYLALPNDPERTRRYHLIGKFLDRYDGRNPKVPDIDRIVPLPPAPLPEWDGTFEWEKAQAHIPPKPSDELIQRMSKAKNLDPATGFPLPPPPKTALGTRVKTGQRCPEDGWWGVRAPNGRVEHRKEFCKGDRLPVYVHWRPRWLSILDDWLPMRYDYLDVEWELLRYPAPPSPPSPSPSPFSWETPRVARAPVRIVQR